MSTAISLNNDNFAEVIEQLRFLVKKKKEIHVVIQEKIPEAQEMSLREYIRSGKVNDPAEYTEFTSLEALQTYLRSASQDAA